MQIKINNKRAKVNKIGKIILIEKMKNQIPLARLSKIK